MNKGHDYIFKFILIGDSSKLMVKDERQKQGVQRKHTVDTIKVTAIHPNYDVGKSCLLLRFTDDRFKTDHQPTLGVQFGSKRVEVDDVTIKIQLWDTAGQESFKAITRSYYKSSIVAFLIYDISRRQSFENIYKWLTEVRDHSPKKILIVLVGNKVDLKDQRQVSREQAQTFAKQNDFAFYQVSAQTGQQVAAMFKAMAETIVNRIKRGEIHPEQQYGIRPGNRTKTNSLNEPTRLEAQNSAADKRSQLGSQGTSGCCSK